MPLSLGGTGGSSSRILRLDGTVFGSLPLTKLKNSRADHSKANRAGVERKGSQDEMKSTVC